MQKNFILRETGIGDIIHFISYFCHTFNSNQINIDFHKANIQEFRNDEKDYYLFLSKIVNFISPANITIVDRLNGQFISMKNIFEHYSHNSSHFRFLDLRNKLNIKIDNNKIILHTKVRQMHYTYYNAIKNDFFKVLNNTDKEIILMGEREIEYSGKEYSELGDKRVYSIYDDAIKFINPKKIIDLSVPKLGVTTPNFEKLLEDMNIMAGSTNICFGSAGNVSICCCVGDTISYAPEPQHMWFTSFLDKKNIYFKYNKDDFFKSIK